MNENNISKHSRLAGTLLAGFVGVLGIHRFYVGKIGTGLLMLFMALTLILLPICGLWAFIDFILLATGSFKDKEGKLLITW